MVNSEKLNWSDYSNGKLEAKKSRTKMCDSYPHIFHLLFYGQDYGLSWG